MYRKRTIHSILLDVLQSLFKCKLALTAFEIKQNIFHPSKITASDVKKLSQLFIRGLLKQKQNKTSDKVKHKIRNIKLRNN